MKPTELPVDPPVGKAKGAPINAGGKNGGRNFAPNVVSGVRGSPMAESQQCTCSNKSMSMNDWSGAGIAEKILAKK